MTHEVAVPRRTKANAVASSTAAAAVLAGLSEGRTLRSLCRALALSPATVQRWRQNDRAFAESYARAREAGFEAIAEEALEIADDCEGDTVVRIKADGSESTAKNADNVQRARLRVETRLKLLAKWHPGRYGDDAEGRPGADLAARVAAARARVLAAQQLAATDHDRAPPASTGDGAA